ncbi:MAG: histidinol dehydrogenase [Actinomycetota bacterium]
MEVPIAQIDLRGKVFSKAEYKKVIPRAAMDIAHATIAIEPILARVNGGSEETLRQLAEELDGIRPEHIRVPPEVIDQALADLDPTIRIALETSIGRVRIVHEAQARKPLTTQVVAGASVTQKWIPVDRVGLYVPGGKAVYPSSVMMNVIPAQIARVPSIAVASPPQHEFDGLPHPTILATCALLGIYEVYAVGGAQAIAMFAYGIAGLCEPVDLVTGPGNIYVAAAKRALRGIIAIDSEAGPTEIGILADESAIANDVAADLISQAEHDVYAAAVLITTSTTLADEVRYELALRSAVTRHSERIVSALTGTQSAIVLVDSIEQGIEVANGYAAEHLELHVKNLEAVASQIRNAGAVFLGRFAPVSLGDYSAGSNHVLPTGGCACHSSGLSVQTFLKGVNFIEYDEAAFMDIAATVITLAKAEDLPAHGEAMSARFEEQK